MSSAFRIKRRVSGASGAPASLKSAELAYNMADGKLYIGFGDDGSGNATSVKAIAEDDFVANLPSGYTTGKILGVSGGVPAWVDAPEGAIYTAGTGLELTGSAFGIDDAIVVTHDALDAILATLATDSEVATALAGKANTSHTHSAADITSGTLDPARLPATVFQAPIVASTNIASLTAPQQADIRAGSTVVTSDGRFWSYVSGTKTVEASYREMADTTPEWSVIANKPSFSTVATSGAYDDLSGKPTLGTMAAQNAASVNITGGTIDGIVFDGGTF